MAWQEAGSEDDLCIVVKKPNISTFLQGIGITICGIPVALVLSALAAFMSSAGVDTSEDVTIYPIWLSLIAFAVVPAIVEEYVFRGVILGAYLQIEERAAVFISSLFFAMLHFSLGSVMYGFMYGCIFALVRVAKIKNNKYNNMKTNVLMPICVGLKLVLRLTEKVFDKSDNKLNYYNG